MKAVANNVIRLAKKNKKAIPKIKSNTPLKRGKRKVGSKNKIVTPKPVEAPFKYTGEIPSRVPVANPSNPKGGGGYSGGSKLGYPLNQGGGGSRVIPPKKIIQPPTRPPMKGPEHYDNSKPVDFTKMPTTYEPTPVPSKDSGTVGMSFGFEKPSETAPFIGRETMKPNGYASQTKATNERKEAMNNFIGIGTGEAKPTVFKEKRGRRGKEREVKGTAMNNVQTGNTPTPVAPSETFEQFDILGDSRRKSLDFAQGQRGEAFFDGFNANRAEINSAKTNSGVLDHLGRGEKAINKATNDFMGINIGEPFIGGYVHGRTGGYGGYGANGISAVPSKTMDNVRRISERVPKSGAKGNFGKLKDRYNGLSDNQKLGVAAFGAGVAGVAVGSFLNRDRGRV